MEANPGVKNNPVSNIIILLCTYILHIGRNQTILGRRIHYGLTGVVFERLSKHLAHFSAFVRSVIDRRKWFYINV